METNIEFSLDIIMNGKNRKAIRKKTQIQKNIILYMDKKKLTKKICPEYKQ